jgi:MFS family permease
MAFDRQKKPPLQGHYWPTVALVLLALCPDLFISTAIGLLQRQMAADLHINVSLIALSSTFSNAGWAFGAVLAADLAQRFPQRYLVLIYEGAFVIGSILVAVAQTPWSVIAGHTVEGTATGMLLIAALPPLITNYPVDRIRSTVAVIAIGLFGGVAAGPLIGGYVAHTGAWREFFAAMGALGILGFIVAALVLELKPGLNPDLSFDALGLALALVGSVLTFYGVGELQSHTYTAPIVLVPATIGLLALGALLILEYRAPNALMPVKPLSTTYPVIGILGAVISGGAYTGMLELTFLLLQKVLGLAPLATGLILWPDLITAVFASVLFGAVFTTRSMLILPPLGMIALMADAGLLATLTSPHMGQGLILGISALLGIGAGLTVSPGLFVGGLSVSSKLVGRAFALVEMLRLAGAFAMVPAFTHFAQVYGTQPMALTQGLRPVFWVIFGIMVGTLGICTLIFVVGGARLHPPDLECYLGGEGEALESPPIQPRKRFRHWSRRET